MGFLDDWWNKAYGKVKPSKKEDAKVEQIPLDPKLQEVVDRGRAMQLGDLKSLESTRNADFEGLSQANIDRQKLILEKQQLPIYSRLRQQELGATQGISDARRQLKERINQTGLANSSMGIAALLGQQREQNRLFEDIKATRQAMGLEKILGNQAIELGRGEYLRNMRLDDIQRRAGITAGILSSPGARPGVKIADNKKQSLLGTLLPLAGAGIGGYLSGSAGGAGVGMGAGQIVASYYDQ